jgi:phosphoglycerate dehydrogenase-like enzyme
MTAIGDVTRDRPKTGRLKEERMKLLLAAREGEAYFDLLDDVPDLEIVRASSPEEALELVEDVDVLYGPPTAEVLAAAPKLRWIQAQSAGVEYVARIPALRESDIILTNTRGAHGPSIGEHVFALLLAFTRGIPDALRWQREKHWGRQEGYRALREIKDATLGLIGFGAIGRGIAQRALGFEMKLLAVDAQAVDGTPYLDEVWPLSRLDELLARADAVVVTAPLTAESRRMLDAAALAKLRPDAYLIVVSRGGIVDEEALAAALRETTIR